QQAAARDFIAGWQARAQRLVAEFRAETVHEAAAPARQALIESLTRESTDFARFWQSHTVLAREGGARSFLHPQRGVLRYVQHNLIPAAHPGYRLVILTAA
ncbi:MAG TPA: XRE family transcriptional regulator, partial [Acidocella sp.]|nr:XRE family transcriptional regulator [Acidocella sp.]